MSLQAELIARPQERPANAQDWVRINLNGQTMHVERDSTILEAARKAGIKIPTLCHHPALKGHGACRLCLVEVEGARSPMVACVTKVTEGMAIRTHTARLQTIRKTLVELLVARHPRECLACTRNHSCELQELAHQFGIDQGRFSPTVRDLPLDLSSPAIIRDPSKCVLCGRCVQICRDVQGVGAIGLSNRGPATVVGPAFNRNLDHVACVACGQCVAVCPVGALREQDAASKVWRALADPSIHTVVQVAPAVRVALGEEFGVASGTAVTRKMVAALRHLGFDQVVDTQFAADVTVVEEGTEFLRRLKVGGPFPLITSCSPGWVKFCEHNYPEFLTNLSTCKSPQQIMGALVKTYYASGRSLDPSRVFSVSVMPCTAKKMEASRPEMQSSGYRDVDAVLTTRELAGMIRAIGVNFAGLPEEKFDLPLGASTGAAAIFGTTGGVMEAALRTVYAKLTRSRLPNLEFIPARGFEGIKEATVVVGDHTIMVAVAHGLGNARNVMDALKTGRVQYHFVEVMACPGGCVGGGGQPRNTLPGVRRVRAESLYREDRGRRVRAAHENPAVQMLYSQFLGSPGSDLAHRLLHTHYLPRDRH